MLNFNNSRVYGDALARKFIQAPTTHTHDCCLFYFKWVILLLLLVYCFVDPIIPIVCFLLFCVWFLFCDVHVAFCIRPKLQLLSF